VVLFIDEIHTVVGAGKADGAMDAGNLLKPALARGQLRCIGATTIDEYRQYIEKDAALERRFQQVSRVAAAAAVPAVACALSLGTARPPLSSPLGPSFPQVMVDQPTVEATVAILRGLKERRGARWTSAPWFLLRPGRLDLPGRSKAPGRSS
jgi:hypothetical protein